MDNLFPKEDLIATMRCQKGALLPCKLDWPIEKICYWGGNPCDSRPPGTLTWSDPWGVVWRKESLDPAMMPFPIDHPIANLCNLDSQGWPEPATGELFTDLVNVRHNSHHLLVGQHPFALYERAWLLVGMQNLLAAMEDCPRRVDELFGHIAAFEETVAQGYIELQVEAAWIADDYGINSAIPFTPERWRRFVRPHLQRIIKRYKDAGILVILHSCGNITPLVNDFMEIGLDVLDPLQPNCNRLEWVRKQANGHMCLCGGIESSILLAGDTGKTAAHTQQRIEQLGAEGGYIVGPDDEWDFPEQTHEAMLNTVEHYRDLTYRDHI